MKRLLIMIITVVVLALCACTHNNGDIGPIFGSWSLMEISEDGTHLELENETVFSFQNELVRVLQVNDNPYAANTRYGNFTLEDEVLSLKFATELSPDGEGYQFLMPTWLYFPTDQMPLRFHVKELKGGRMVLTLDNAGKTYTYSFMKTW